MKNDIIKITENITSQYETATSDNLWKIFKEQLLNSTETNIPHKLTTGKKKLPWVDDQLSLHKKRKNSEAQMKKYKHIKKTIQQDMRKAYWEYIEKMIFNIKNQMNAERNNQKNLFSYIKSMKTDNTGIAALRKDGILTDNTKDKADIRNEQFKKAFLIETSSEQIPDKGKSSYPLMNNIAISESGVTKLLQNINPHKATGPDEICGRVMKELSTTISRPLTLIFQKTLETGKIPYDWKHANVCPVFKKGDKHNAINYRPISLTCIMEHIIASNLMKHLESNNILYDLQHGFRSSRSCETQLISFIQKLAKTTTIKYKLMSL